MLLDCKCILVSSVNKSILILSVNRLVISLMTIMKSKGPINEPWGTPDSTFLNLEYELFIFTDCFLLVRKHSIHFNILPVIPISY